VASKAPYANANGAPQVKQIKSLNLLPRR
jgi:hypothetical protein